MDECPEICVFPVLWHSVKHVALCRKLTSFFGALACDVLPHDESWSLFTSRASLTAGFTHLPCTGACYIMSAPQPFIQLDPKTGQLRVTDEARASLSKLRGTVAVCAVAGVYRTGKSYILNQLAGRQSGFGVGSSVQACTKGIWMWGAPRNLEGSTPGAPKHLLLLDTEGLASISQTEGHDAKIFCLALLLSSFFVYNSEKAINSAAIDQLSLVVQLIQKIRVHAEVGSGLGLGLGQR